MKLGRSEGRSELGRTEAGEDWKLGRRCGAGGARSRQGARGGARSAGRRMGCGAERGARGGGRSVGRRERGARGGGRGAGRSEGHLEGWREGRGAEGGAPTGRAPCEAWRLLEAQIARTARRQKAAIRPNREALDKIPNRPNRCLMTPAVQWELKVVARAFLCCRDGFEPSLVHNCFWTREDSDGWKL